MLGDAEVEVLRDRELAAFARAHLAGAAGGELIEHADRRRVRRRHRGVRRLRRFEAQLAEHALADGPRVAHAQRVGDGVHGVGAIHQIEIANAEVAADVLAP